MTLNGRTLRWTPAADSVTPDGVEAVVTVSVGGASQDQTLKLDVSFPGVDLPFAATQLVPSPDGRTALAASQGGNDPFMHRGNPGEAAGTELALLDLAKPAVAARRAAAARTRSRSTTVRLRRAGRLRRGGGAEPRGPVRRETRLHAGGVSAMTAAGGKLYVACQSQRGTQDVFTLSAPDFKFTPSPTAYPTGAMRRSGGTSAAVPTWTCRVASAGTGCTAASCTTRPWPSRSCWCSRFRSSSSATPAGCRTTAPGWARFAPFYSAATGGGGSSVTLMRLDGRQIKQIDGMKGLVLPDVPAAVALKNELTRGPAIGSNGSPDMPAARVARRLRPDHRRRCRAGPCGRSR